MNNDFIITDIFFRKAASFEAAFCIFGRLTILLLNTYKHHTMTHINAHIGCDHYSCTLSSQDHSIIADEPLDLGGQNTGMNPYELLLSALGACTVITVRMYADRKQWPLEEIKVELSHEKKHCEDCEAVENPSAKLDFIERKIQFIGALDDSQKERLLNIANKCPVHKTLSSTIKISTSEK